MSTPTTRTPTTLYLWFTDEITGVGVSADASRENARRRCLAEHAEYIADPSSGPNPETAQSWLAMLDCGLLLELRVHGSPAQARKVFEDLVRNSSETQGWRASLNEALGLKR